MGITHELAAIVVAALMSSAVAGQTPASTGQKTPPQAEATITGCITAARAESAAPHTARTIYTLDTTPTTAAARSNEKGQPAKSGYVLSGDQSTLSKHVGQKVQLTGELLMPPSAPIGASDPTARTKPLPGDAEGTFRVTSVKVLSSKCS
jgi:hypothetical protein